MRAVAYASSGVRKARRRAYGCAALRRRAAALIHNIIIITSPVRYASLSFIDIDITPLMLMPCHAYFTIRCRRQMLMPFRLMRLIAVDCRFFHALIALFRYAAC